MTTINLTTAQVTSLLTTTSVMVIEVSPADIAALNAGGSITLQGPIPTPVPSPNDTLVVGTSGEVVDAALNTWAINASGQVVINGVPDTGTANVVKLAYVNAVVWQKNKSNLWWKKTSPTAAWLPTAGTAVPPIAGA